MKCTFIITLTSIECVFFFISILKVSFRKNHFHKIQNEKVEILKFVRLLWFSFAIL